MRRWVNHAIELFNDWLASESGFVQAVVLTLLWTAAAVVGWDRHGFAFLFFATAVSFVTQFNLALIGRRSGQKVDQALAALLELAKSDEQDGDALLERAEAMGDALEAVQLAVEKLHEAMAFPRPDTSPDA